ncbi:3-hydroxyacyl-ACP dehydratase FabZ [Alphaproteobacteria bacterium]|jgi:3-hydroxymyristoyl/3-hydroxydecanoyl-(acyl carrier protein) dehydratase|nr:3-hydroxyacyl-ACP dehydratase FabZ [Alphaproteobacteria bacterium]MDC3270281.1 3-hydroxyacyl-ACP dehydratase FabZ [Alphaproteobacteria bacterium]
MILNIEEIKKLIPHRKPFLFIEECKILKKGKIGESFRTFNESEYFFEGHFPDNPIVPGVVIVEAMAQTAGVVVSENLINTNDQSVLFMSINKAKFRKPVLPNYKIIFFVELMNNIKNVYKFMGKAYHNDSLVAESEFSAMITGK